MDFLEIANARQSCRSYDSRPVEEEKLNAVLEAVRLAPSACNSQPYPSDGLQRRGGEGHRQGLPGDGDE